MADQEKTPKTKTIGYLPVATVKTIKGWDDYKKKAKDFADAKAALEPAKKAIREVLKQKLNQNGDIDFIEEEKRIRVFENLQKKDRDTRARDLSESFRS